MPSRQYSPSQLKSTDSIKLGRLVHNVEHPQQEFYDPFPDRPDALELYTNHQTNFHQVNNNSKCTKLQSYLTDILSLRTEARSDRIARITSPQVTTHELQKSNSWYEAACRSEETRKWIENAVHNGHDMYLIVGSFILQDAKLFQTVTAGGTGMVGIELPLATLSAAIASPATPISLTSVVKLVKDATYGHMVAFEAPGDQVFGIRYRKVKFKWFSSLNVDSSFLDKKTRWKHYLRWRGEDDEEDEEDEDVLEASLTDDDDLDTTNYNEEIVAASFMDDIKAPNNEDEDRDEEMHDPKPYSECEAEASDEELLVIDKMGCDEIETKSFINPNASNRGESSCFRTSEDREEQGGVSVTRLPKLCKKRRKRLLKRLLDKSKKPKPVKSREGRAGGVKKSRRE